MYQPSTEVLRFEGIVNGENDTKLFSFKDEGNYPRYFNQKLAQIFKFAKRMRLYKNIDEIANAIEAGVLVKSDFVITDRNNIYEMTTDDEYQAKGDAGKRLGQKYARSQGWVLPKTAVVKDSTARAKGMEKKPPNTESTSFNEIVAESKYQAPIPAGELSAMLAELSSMDNTESEYASEDISEYEEFASEEF